MSQADTPPITPAASLGDVEPATLSPHPREIFIGEAGTHFVLSRLLSWGIPAHAAGPGLPYDVIADPGEGFGLIRIQAKATTVERDNGFRFVLKRGYHRTRRGIFDYCPGDFDIASFVTLRHDRVLFQTYPVHNFRARYEDFVAEGAERESWAAALEMLLAQRWTPPGGGPIPPAV
jgi:hypothetical protein